MSQINPADSVALRGVIDAQGAESPIGVAYSALNDVQCALLLSMLTTTEQRLRPMQSTFQLSSLMQPASVAAVFNHPRFSDFRDTFNSGNREGVIEWATVFALTGAISDSEKTAIAAHLSGTVETQVPLVPGVTPDHVFATRGIQ